MEPQVASASGLAGVWAELDRRHFIVGAAICVALLAAIAMSPALWFTGRTFPRVPALSVLSGVPPVVDAILSGFLMAGLILVGGIRRNRPLYLALAIVGGALALLDVNRLQPWFYQYLLFFVALSLRGRRWWSLCAFIIAATYIWSGLQKANLAFSENVWPWLLRPFGAFNLQPWWWLAPVVEISAGVCLLFPKSRSWGIRLAVGMHLVLLIALGPVGRNYNAIVWPWNLCICVVVLALFFREEAPVLPAMLRLWPERDVAILVGILPALSFVGGWNDNLSAGLYSGRTRQGFIALTSDLAVGVPEEIRMLIQKSPGRIGLDITQWASRDLGVPPFPSNDVYKAAAGELVMLGAPRKSMVLVVSQPMGLAESKAIFKTVEFP